MFGRKAPITKGAHLKEHTAGTSNELSFDVLDAARRQLDDKNFEPNAIKVKAPRQGVGVVSLLFSKIHFGKSENTSTSSASSGVSSNLASSGSKSLATGPSAEKSQQFAVSENKSPKNNQREIRKNNRAEARALKKSQKQEKYNPWRSLSRATGSAPYSQESAQAEIERRKKIRHRHKVRLIALVVVVGIVGLGVAGNYAYQQYRLYTDRAELLNSAVEDISNADTGIVELDSLIDDPLSAVKSEKWTALQEKLPEIKENLESAQKIGKELVSVLGDSNMRTTADQVIDACTARQTMINAGDEIFNSAIDANDVGDSITQIWSDVLAADTVARDGVSLLSEASIDQSMVAAQEKFAEAKASFQNAKYALQELENDNANLDLSKQIEYLDKRIEALDYATATAQALVDRNKTEATAQAQLYNEADAAAVKLAGSLPSDPAQAAKDMFEINIKNISETYNNARYAASVADDLIREYLGV